MTEHVQYKSKVSKSITKNHPAVCTSIKDAEVLIHTRNILHTVANQYAVKFAEHMFEPIHGTCLDGDNEVGRITFTMYDLFTKDEVLCNCFKKADAKKGTPAKTVRVDGETVPLNTCLTQFVARECIGNVNVPPVIGSINRAGIERDIKAAAAQEYGCDESEFTVSSALISDAFCDAIDMPVKGMQKRLLGNVAGKNRQGQLKIFIAEAVEELNLGDDPKIGSNAAVHAMCYRVLMEEMVSHKGLQMCPLLTEGMEIEVPDMTVRLTPNSDTSKLPVIVKERSASEAKQKDDRKKGKKPAKEIFEIMLDRKLFMDAYNNIIFNKLIPYVNEHPFILYRNRSFTIIRAFTDGKQVDGRYSTELHIPYIALILPESMKYKMTEKEAEARRKSIREKTNASKAAKKAGITVEKDKAMVAHPWTHITLHMQTKDRLGRYFRPLEELIGRAAAPVVTIDSDDASRLVADPEHPYATSALTVHISYDHENIAPFLPTSVKSVDDIDIERVIGIDVNQKETLLATSIAADKCGSLFDMHRALHDFYLEHPDDMLFKLVPAAREFAEEFTLKDRKFMAVFTVGIRSNSKESRCGCMVLSTDPASHFFHWMKSRTNADGTRYYSERDMAIIGDTWLLRKHARHYMSYASKYYMLQSNWDLCHDTVNEPYSETEEARSLLDIMTDCKDRCTGLIKDLISKGFMQGVDADNCELISMEDANFSDIAKNKPTSFIATFKSQARNLVDMKKLVYLGNGGAIGFPAEAVNLSALAVHEFKDTDMWRNFTVKHADGMVVFSATPTHLYRVTNFGYLCDSKLHNVLSMATLKNIVGSMSDKKGICTMHVNPKHTSQMCSCCGYTSKDNRDDRVFVCPECGFTDHADWNATKNIRKRAIDNLIARNKKKLKSDATDCAA